MNKLIIFTMCVLFYSCSTSKFNLEKLNSKKVEYEKLPEQIKGVYSDYAIKTPMNFEVVTKSFDEGYELNYKYSGEEKPYVSEVANNEEIIKINNIEFTMTNGYAGYPFVLLDKTLYMSYELNLHKANYDKVKYIVIDLSKELQ